MKFDPTGLVPLNFSDCWLILYFALSAAAPRHPKPPSHPVEKAAAAAKAPGGSGLEPSLIIEVLPAGLRLAGRPLGVEGLPGALRKAGLKDSPLTVEVRVADGVPYQNVDAVLTAARDASGVKLRLRRLQ